MKNKERFLVAALMGCLAVIIGAFGAHGLKPKLSVELFEVYEKGVQYHFYHVFALFISLFALQFVDNRWVRWSSSLFILGIVFFSGSLYLLACRELLGIEGWRGVLGPVTPLGGLCFILGWFFLGVGVKSEE